jgi:transposase-like protein
VLGQITVEGHSVPEVAKRLGITTKSLYGWRVRYGESPERAVQIKADQVENQRLRKEHFSNRSYRTIFGTPVSESEWRLTSWRDQTCDVLVTLIDKTVSPGIRDNEISINSSRQVILSIESLKRTENQKEASRNKAKSLAE